MKPWLGLILISFGWCACTKKSNTSESVEQPYDSLVPTQEVAEPEEDLRSVAPRDTVMELYFSIDSDSLMISPGQLLDLIKQFRKTAPVKNSRQSSEHVDSNYATYWLGTDSLTIYKEYFNFWIEYSNEQFYFKDDSLMLYRKYTMVQNEVTEHIYQFFQKKCMVSKRSRTTDKETMQLPNPYLPYFSLETFRFATEQTSVNCYSEFMQRWYDVTHPLPTEQLDGD